MTVATTFEKLFKPHFGGLKFLVHKDLLFWKNHATYSHIGFIQIKYGNTETQRSWPFNMHSWIGSFNQEIADPIRSDPGLSDMDLDPIQIHKNRIFDPDRGSFRSDHYINANTNTNS